MSLLKRFFYYLFGFAFGIILVVFIWKEKGVSFDYGMDARTLKSIRNKTLIYSENAQLLMKKTRIDSAVVQLILLEGNVDFRKSDQRGKPCPKYLITGKYLENELRLYVVRCDSTATIDKIILKTDL